MTFKATEAELKSRLANLNARKADLKAEKTTFDAALKRAKSDCEYNSTMRLWNQADIKAAKDELKAAKAAEKARKAEAKANKPKRKTAAQKRAEQAEEQRRADEAADAAWREYQEQVRRTREQNEAARRVREEAERVRAAQAQGGTVSRASVADELRAAPYNLCLTTIRVRNNFEFRCEISSAEVKRLRRIFVLANMDAANSATNHDKIAFANAIFDEIDSEKRAYSEDMSAANRAAASEAQAAYRARRSEWFV